MALLEIISQHLAKIHSGILIGVAVFIVLTIKGRGKTSQFRTREAERADLDRILKQGPDLGQAKLAKHKKSEPAPPPLRLPGLTLAGEPHEILGISENANESEIMRAYKEAIKRFHPDRIQGQAEEQLRFYQEASAKINDAKNEMMKRVRGNR
jgi:hypothetical protein